MNHLVKVVRIVALCLLISAGARAQGQSTTVDGVTAYFGVVPSELARDMEAVHGAADRDAHGRPIVAGDDHHFLVALFDAVSGTRITDAHVTAAHTARGVIQRKPLQPMTVGEGMTYGNFFALDPGAKHEFLVEVGLPAHKLPIRFQFTYGPEKATKP